MSDHGFERRHSGHAGPDTGIHQHEWLPIDSDLNPDDPGEPSTRHHPGHLHRAGQRAALAAITLGGVIGSGGRYELERAWTTQPDNLPWATLAVNSSGAFLLGLILTLLLQRSRRNTLARPFLCVGVLGSWTTMSTFAVETDLLVRHGHITAAIGYLSATVIGGLALTGAGIAAARALTTRKAAPCASR